MQRKELEADLVELGSLLERVERKRVPDLLKEEQQKVEKQQKEQHMKREAAPCAPSEAPHTVKITNYGGTLSWLPTPLVYAQQHFYVCLFYSLGPVRDL